MPAFPIRRDNSANRGYEGHQLESTANGEMFNPLARIWQADTVAAGAFVDIVSRKFICITLPARVGARPRLDRSVLNINGTTPRGPAASGWISRTTRDPAMDGDSEEEQETKTQGRRQKSRSRRLIDDLQTDH